MSTNRLKHLYDRKPDIKAVEPLLKPDAEEARVLAVMAEQRRQDDLDRRSKNLQAILKKGLK